MFEAEAHADDAKMIGRFATDRACKYRGLAARAQGLLDEIAKEIAARKFTFAELEEVEDNLKKLDAWLVKIAARDFFAGRALVDAQKLIVQCRDMVGRLGANVFKAYGFAPQ